MLDTAVCGNCCGIHVHSFFCCAPSRGSPSLRFCTCRRRSSMYVVHLTRELSIVLMMFDVLSQSRKLSLTPKGAVVFKFQAIYYILHAVLVICDIGHNQSSYPLNRCYNSTPKAHSRTHTQEEYHRYLRVRSMVQQLLVQVCCRKKMTHHPPPGIYLNPPPPPPGPAQGCSKRLVPPNDGRMALGFAHGWPWVPPKDGSGFHHRMALGFHCNTRE